MSIIITKLILDGEKFDELQPCLAPKPSEKEYANCLGEGKLFFLIFNASF